MCSKQLYITLLILKYQNRIKEGRTKVIIQKGGENKKMPYRIEFLITWGCDKILYLYKTFSFSITNKIEKFKRTMYGKNNIITFLLFFLLFL